jgi:hypothetical protein
METTIAVRPSSPMLRTWGFSWPLLAWMAAVVVLIAGNPPDDLLQDADTYWHLAVGRWIVENGAVPMADPFSHSMPGVPWAAFEWLSELVMYGVYDVAGWAGLVVLTACCFGLVLAILARFLVARMEPVHALLFTGLAAGLMMTHVLVRPHVMAWVLLSVWMSTLVNAAEAGRRPPWWLLGLMVVWVNMHGTFLLGLALGFGMALDAVLAHPRATRMEAAKPWALFAALSALAALVTPSGWLVLAHAVHILQMKVALVAIQEWWSPNFQHVNPLEVWLLLVFGLALAGRVRLPWLRMLLLLGLVHLALKHQRNISVLGLVAPFLIATAFARQWRATAVPGKDAEWLDRAFMALRPPARPMTVAVCVAAVAFFAATATHLRPPAPAAPITPKAALQAALAAGAKGPVLNDYNFGGFLIFERTPVFIDGRADMYGDALMEKWLHAINLKSRKALIDFLAEYKIGWIMLTPDRPAIAVLDDLPGWRRVYADDKAVVHVRVEAGAQR